MLRGAGDRSFVAGTDIRQFLEFKTREDALNYEARSGRILGRLFDMTKPTIAMVQGDAVGGGLFMAIACDLRVAAEGARFGFPETGLGIIPGGGGTQRLPRAVGMARAKHLILTGEVIGADEALRLGLVSKVVPLASLGAAAQALAEQVLSRGPLATRLAKQALDITAEAPLAAGLAYEALAQTVAYESADKVEGTSAFLEKRKPRFRGE